MLALSMTVNPECEHIEGDMRTLRLGHTFDAVFLHDAVMYLTLCCSTRPEGFERAWTTTVQAGGRPAPARLEGGDQAQLQRSGRMKPRLLAMSTRHESSPPHDHRRARLVAGPWSYGCGA
jgi:hypothetical protein